MGDIYTAREFGLMSGAAWAEVRALQGDLARVGRAADGVIDDETHDGVMVKSGMVRRLEELRVDGVEREFWEGFVRGVRAVVVDHLNSDTDPD